MIMHETDGSDRMKLPLSLIPSLAVIVLSGPAFAAAPGTFEPLAQAGKDAPFCTAANDICVSGTRDGAFAVTVKGKPLAQWTAAQTDAQSYIRKYRPLPTLLRLKDGGMLVAVGEERNQMYSGGSAAVTFQHLMLVRPGKPPVEVLEAPYDSDISIRACFSEKDMKQRLDACADQYTLKSSLTVAPGDGSALPRLIFDVKATNYPRGVRRDADSLEMAPLKKADLVEETDARCTYRRAYTFDAAAGTYRPDAALPECEAYTVP